MKKRILFTFLFFTIIFISCKDTNEKKTSPKEQTIKESEVVTLNDDLENVLLAAEEQYMQDTDSCYKLFVIDEKLYYVCENPTDKDKSARFFLHVNLMSGEKVNLDFKYNTFEVKDVSSFKHGNYAIASRELPLDEIYSILTGQFDDTGRLWQKVLHENEILNLN